MGRSHANLARRGSKPFKPQTVLLRRKATSGAVSMGQLLR